MGLDIYIEKRIYIGAQYPRRKVTGTIDLYTNQKKIDIELNRLDSVIETVYHGRKLWWLYDWLINVKECPVDNGSSTYVDREEMKNLHNSCTEVLDAWDSKNDWKVKFEEKFCMPPPKEPDEYTLADLTQLRDSLANVTNDTEADYSVTVSY